MGRVTPGQGVTAIVFGVLEIIMGIVIIICGFVAAAKIDNALYSPYWAGFVVSGFQLTFSAKISNFYQKSPTIVLRNFIFILGLKVRVFVQVPCII